MLVLAADGLNTTRVKLKKNPLKSKQSTQIVATFPYILDSL